ncbi:cell division ATPase MinD [Candidatus Woesearchaeota archaeon]|nr:cell division ATPase MinD [Candidatus Woesearchaeota archaeon]
MSRYICIVSGKGGVGKTTSAISLAHAMGKHKKTLLVDANLTTPNVNIHLGAPVLRKTLMSVLRDEASLKQAIYTHESGLRLVPTISNVHDLKRLKFEKLKNTIRDLEGEADIILLDSGAGLSREAISAIEASDEVLIIINPELSSVLDAQKTIQVAQELGKTILGVVVNKVKEDKHELKVNEVEKLLNIPVIGAIPYDKSVRKAQKKKYPVTHSHPKSKASKEYERVAGLLLGEKYFSSINKKSRSMQDYVLKEMGLGE